MKYLFTTLITLLMSAVNVLADGAKSKVPLADPYVLLDGDTYYAYGTHTPTVSRYGLPTTCMSGNTGDSP